MQYFLRVVNGQHGTQPQWEEVDEHVFRQRKLVVWEETNSPRYDEDTWAILEGGNLHIQGHVPIAHLPYFLRLAGIKEIPTERYSLWGNPEYVQILGRQGTLRLHKVGTSAEQDFVRRPVKQAA